MCQAGRQSATSEPSLVLLAVAAILIIAFNLSDLQGDISYFEQFVHLGAKRFLVGFVGEVCNFLL